MGLLIHHPVPRELVLRVTNDLLTGEDVRKLVRQPTDVAGAQLHLDLSGVRIPTAAGLGGLVRLNTALRARGARLVLLNVQPWAYEVFAATRLTEVLDVRAA
jgi:anti-anti-sigma factor